MIKTILLTLLLIYSFSLCTSNEYEDSIENSFSRHTVFFEIGGLGLFTSLNYEFYIFRFFGIRAGYGYAPWGYGFPFAINYYLGKEKRLELGIGFLNFHLDLYNDEERTFFRRLSSEESTDNFVAVTVGYSYKKNPKGLLLRGSFHPIYHLEKKQFFVAFGFSIGYGF
jgi:hypothetical protein